MQIKVKVNTGTLQNFAQQLMMNQLDRSAIIGETYCENDDPTIGISYWKVEDMEEFENKFTSWKQFYETYEVKEVITAKEAIMKLFSAK